MALILDMNQDLEEAIRRRIDEEQMADYSVPGLIMYTGDFLEEYIGEQLPELEFPWNSFFDNALEKVDWEELSEHYLKEWGLLTRGGRKPRHGPKEWSP